MIEVARRRTQQERREGTIRKLLDAAAETLIEVGYSEASVQRICARAEVSQGALFRHFASRGIASASSRCRRARTTSSRR